MQELSSGVTESVKFFCAMIDAHVAVFEMYLLSAWVRCKLPTGYPQKKNFSGIAGLETYTKRQVEVISSTHTFFSAAARGGVSMVNCVSTRRIPVRPERTHMVRAKFHCSEITKQQNSDGYGIKLTPVYSDNPQHENKAFWDATPCGEISMFITNPAAAGAFELGAEYYVDFTKALATDAD